MNARRVNAAAGVICAAQKQRQTPAGIAAALEAAGLLQSPESAAELVALRERTAELEAATYVAPSPSCARCYGADALRFVAKGGATAPCRACAPLELEELRARVAELEALTPAPIQTCRSCGAGYTYGEACSVCTYKRQMAEALGHDLPEVKPDPTTEVPLTHVDPRPEGGAL